MYARIVKAAVQAGQLDEMATRWEANVGTRMQQAPGFRHAYFVGNRESGAVTGVTLWDTPPDEAALRQVMQEFQPKVADIMTGPPTVEDYEVLVEL
ncbi:MAG: antibiotic biosynthesis monooxygenase family protein [Thermomicrobiales bacterium]